MHPIAALMLSTSLEEERRRVLLHRRRWLSEEPISRGEHRSARFGWFRLPQISGLLDTKA